MQKCRIRVTMLMKQDILINAMISSFCVSMYLSYFRFQSKAWQDEGVMFFSLTNLTMKKLRVFLFIIYKKAGPA